MPFTQRYCYRYVLFSTLLLSLIMPLCAEELGSKIYRLEVNPQWYSFDDYVIKGPIGVAKTKNVESDRERVYTRPSVAIGFSDHWTARAGLYAAYNHYETLPSTLEIRPYVGLGYFQSLEEMIDPIDLSAYLRVEDRVRYDIDTWDNTHNWRARLRVWGIYNLHPSTIENSWHRVILGAELLRTYFNKDELTSGIEDNFEVETRLSLAIERTLKENQKIRFDVSWRYQVPFNEIHDAKFNTFVFTIKYFPVWGDLLRNRLFHNVDE